MRSHVPQRLVDVVGDEQHACAAPIERARQPPLQLLARDRVQRARTARPAAAPASPPAACAGRRPAGASRPRARPGRRPEAPQPEPPEQRRAPPHAPRARRTLCADQRQRGVVERASPRQQQVALRHQRARGQAPRRSAAPDTAIAPARLLEPADQAQQRRLATSAGPDHSDTLAGTHLDGEVIQHRELAVAVADGADRDRCAGGRDDHGPQTTVFSTAPTPSTSQRTTPRPAGTRADRETRRHRPASRSRSGRPARA